MQLVKVGAAVLNQTPMDWAGNKARILKAIDAARAEGVTVLCLPELSITGYGCEDAFHSPDAQERAWETLMAIQHASKGMIVAVGAPSSLAVELAASAGVCTVGFTSTERFVTYSLPERVGV